MLRRISIAVYGCLFSVALTAQTKPAPNVKINPQPAVKLNPQPGVKLNPQPAIAPAPMPVAPIKYKKLNSAIEYSIVLDKPTSPHPKEGDVIKVNMVSACNNKLLFSSAQKSGGKPAEFSVNKPNFVGDIIEPIMLMTPGDSMVCLVNSDPLFKNTNNKRPDFIKPGDKIQYFIKLVSVKPKEQVQKEQQEAFNKQIKEQMEKQKKESAKTLAKDDKDLQAYFKKNNITPLKTASGLYYTIQEPGSGDNPKTGDTAVMNYTGTLLDGTKFDSNEDTAFHHTTPFEFALGKGQVIKGWDEGIALLKPGAKATLYIPSPLAYGAQARPGGGANPKGIPANSILLFNVQLNSVKPPVPVPAQPQQPSTESQTPKN